MGMAADLVARGFTGYQGWGDAEAAADFASTKGAGKGSDNGGGGGGFNFDYAGEAQKAYGDLGAYYDRLLTESKGDLKLALSRMVEDYNTGLRIRRESTATSKADVTRRQAIATDRGQGNLINRGLFSQSQFTPNQPGTGYGVGDTILTNLITPFINANKRLDTSQANYEEAAALRKARTETDLPLKQTRYEANLEQNRRKEAASLANTRGTQAYQDYLNKQNTF